MIDWRGNAYDVGSTVLYPRMSGSACEMTEATVMKITSVIVDVEKLEDWIAWDKRAGLPVSGARYGSPEYNAYSALVQERRAATPRLRWTEQREDVTIMLLPINSSRFRMGKLNKDRENAQAWERFEDGQTISTDREQFAKWHQAQKSVRITIVQNITAV